MIFVLGLVVACSLACLVATRKVTFPIMFDVGLTCFAFAALIFAYEIEQGAFPRLASVMAGLGLISILLSFLRQTGKRRARLRHGAPKEITDSLQWVNGGKQ